MQSLSSAARLSKFDELKKLSCRVIAVAIVLTVATLVMSPSTASAQTGGGPGGGGPGGGGGGNSAPVILLAGVSIDPGTGNYIVTITVDDEAPGSCTFEFIGAFKGKIPVSSSFDGGDTFEFEFADADEGPALIFAIDHLGLESDTFAAPVP